MNSTRSNDLDLPRARAALAQRSVARRTVSNAAKLRNRAARDLKRAALARDDAYYETDRAVADLNSVLDDWDGFDERRGAELAQARSERARAERGRSRAEVEYARAERTYARAERTLARTEQALADCEPIDLLDIMTLTVRRVALFAMSDELRTPKPPALAEYCLELLASPEWSEAAAGDFFEMYERKFRRVRGRHGVIAAKFDYWWQVLRAAPGLLRIRISHLAVAGGLAKAVQVVEKYWTIK
jgi:hypothetical protein